MYRRTIVPMLCLPFVLAGCAATHAPAAAGSPAELGARSEGAPQKAARARLRAVIRDQSFIEQLSESVRNTGIFEPFAGRMVIWYTVDEGGAARGAQAADLAESGVTRESLRAVVEWNLSGPLREPVSCTSHALGEPARRGYYESSRLLLDKQWAELAAQAGTVVIAVPSNDMLLVACNPTQAILQQLAAVVQNTYPQTARPVSASLLLWSKDGFRELPAP